MPMKNKEKIIQSLLSTDYMNAKQTNDQGQFNNNMSLTN